MIPPPTITARAWEGTSPILTSLPATGPSLIVPLVPTATLVEPEDEGATP